MPAAPQIQQTGKFSVFDRREPAKHAHERRALIKASRWQDRADGGRPHRRRVHAGAEARLHGS